MTSEQLPSEFMPFGHVVGRVISAVGDTAADPDADPEAIPVTGVGLVRFTPLELTRVVAGTVPSTWVQQKTIAADLDSKGFLALSGARGLLLWPGAWKVSAGSDSVFSFPAFTIKVTAAHTSDAPLDLWTAAPYSPPSGVTVTTLVVPAGQQPGQTLGWDGAQLAWVTPKITPTVTTLAAGSDATAAMSGSWPNLTLGLGIPVGPAGATTLPVMSVRTGDLADPTKDAYSFMTWTLAGDGIDLSGTGRIKGRGNSTWNLPKKPWKLKLDSKVQMPGHAQNSKDWVLLANHFDASKLNGAFALELGSKMSGLAWTPQATACELVINGTYCGLMQIVDPVKLEKGRVSGAQILEFDNKERPGGSPPTSDPGFTTTRYLQFLVFDDPDGNDPSVNAKVVATVNAFEEQLLAGNWSAVWQAADMRSFVDWWLINEVTHNTDSTFWSSCKMTIDDNDKLWMGPLWDFDLSLSIGWVTDNWVPGGAPATGWWTLKAAWLTRMWDDPDFRAMAASRWSAMKKAIAAMGGIQKWCDDSMASLIDPIRRDDTRWGLKTFPASEISIRVEWMKTRMAWIDNHITDTTITPDTLVADITGSSL